MSAPDHVPSGSVAPLTYIFTTGRGILGCDLAPPAVAAQLASMGPSDWYDIGNGTLIRVGAIVYLQSADS